MGIRGVATIVRCVASGMSFEETIEAYSQLER